MGHLQPLITESIQLMLIGMGTVFTILILLIFLINLVSRLLPEEDVVTLPASQSDRHPQPVEGGAPNDAELIAVIGAAISRYRKAHH